MNVPEISIVSPVYKAENLVYELYRRLSQVLPNISNNYEIILVNDRSPQNDWEEIKKIAQNDTKVKAVNLSRNFGQHYAITAGLSYATGKYVVVMDCDLQDQPEEIIKLYETIKNSTYDVVFGRRYQRKDGFFKKLSSKLFFKIYHYFTEAKYDHTVANFSIAKKVVVKSVLQLNEHNRTYPLLIRWVGFNVGYVNINHANRSEGKSSYTLKKLINLAADAIISQSNKPLKLSIYWGFFMSFISMIVGLYFLWKKIFHDIPITGWTSLIVSLFFIGGLIMANIGILGLYIGKTFNEVKNRPLFIVKETINCNEKQEE